MYTFDTVDNYMLIQKMLDRGLTYMSALQEITSMIHLSLYSGGEIQESHSFDRGTGYYFKVEDNEGFFASNQFENTNVQIINMVDMMTSKSYTIQSQSIEHQDTITKSRFDITWAKTPLFDKIDFYHDLIIDIHSYLKNTDFPLKFNINFEGTNLTKNFQSSDNMDITQVQDRLLLGIELFSKKHNFLIRDILGGIEGDIKWEDVEKMLDSMFKIFRDAKDMQSIQNGNYSAILLPDVSYSLIHESIGHGVEADQIVNGNSFLTNRLGYPVATEDLTIIDDPHLRSLGWAEFDDEGVKTQGTVIVEEGILNEYLHSNKTAEQLNTFSTGNARASSYKVPPEPRQSNLFIEPRDYSLEEMQENMGTGLILSATKNASTSLFSGEVSIDLQYGYFVDKGEIQHMVSPFKMYGNALGYLDNIEAIGKETTTIPSICLKGDSKLYIGAILPALHINCVSIYR